MGSNNLFNRILLTGAAGGLGTALRQTLKPYASILRLSDIVPLKMGSDENADGIETVVCDLANKKAVYDLVSGCDAIVHMGGVSVERPFEEVLQANIMGVFHIYEAARRHGVKRIVFASSNHAIGFYKQTDKIDTRAARRPDGYYGLSKAYGEETASFYHDRYGVETVSIRIGSCFPVVKDRRMMHTWISARDLTELIRCALYTPQVGHTIIYGVSNNKEVWWDNRYASKLNFIARDSSEIFRTQVEQQPEPADTDPVSVYQGGAFTAEGPFEENQASKS